MFDVSSGPRPTHRYCDRCPERLYREESEHRSAVRQIPAFHTLATLCQLASVAGVGGHPSPVEILRGSTLAPLKSFQAQERPEKGGKSKGRAFRQVTSRCFRYYLVSLVVSWENIGVEN